MSQPTNRPSEDGGPGSSSGPRVRPASLPPPVVATGETTSDPGYTEPPLPKPETMGDPNRTGSSQPPDESARPRPAPFSVPGYEVLGELGRGGMGVVYRAWQPSLGRQVALKSLLRPGDPKAEARFRREIAALGHVEHPHLVRILTSGAAGTAGSTRWNWWRGRRWRRCATGCKGPAARRVGSTCRPGDRR